MILPTTWNVPESLRRRLGPTTYGRQRAIVEEGHLILVLHKAPTTETSGREGVLFWRKPDGEWHANRGKQSAGALRSHVQEYADIEAELTERFDAASDLESLFDLLGRLTPLARAARNMHAALQSAREDIGDDPFLIEMRDLASDVDREMELLLEDVRNAVAYRTAREAEEQAKLGREEVGASHRLNILAALFLPITAVASIFGMNLTYGIDSANPLVFWGVLASGVLIGLLMKGWVLQRPK